MAQQAAALVDEKGMAVSYEKDKAAGEDTVKFENIELGLYLVMVDAVKSPYYFYSFSPYLVAVPGNDYYSSGDDSWIYELTEKQAVGLKPAREPRLGDLVIRKNLTSLQCIGGRRLFCIRGVCPAAGRRKTGDECLSDFFLTKREKMR